MKKINTHCANCGAPVTTEICPYCNVFTGIDTKYADMEYPIIECKEANIGFWNVLFPMIFAVSFGFFGFMFPIAFALTDPKEFIPVVLSCSIFALVGVVAFVIGIKPVLRFMSIKRSGQEIEATVYGYMDDNVLLNGRPAQIVKLLINTNDGEKFILYQLGDIKQPYKINSKIKLKVHKDIFLIENKKQYYFE
jgi:hypothetical protein